MIKAFTNKNLNDAHAYLVINERTNNAILVDTAVMGLEIVKYLKDNNLDLSAVVLTHGHYDHVKNLDQITKAFPLVKIWIHKKDLKALYDAKKNLSALRHNPWKMSFNPNVKTFSEPISVKMGEFNVNLKPHPGHTNGSIFIEIPELDSVFIGDTLFIKNDEELFGRHKWYQLQTNPFKFRKTIKTIFNDYSDNWLIYPGHWDYGFKLETIKDEAKIK